MVPKDQRKRRLFFAQLPSAGGCLSYVVGDRGSLECAVVDPLQDLAPVQALVAEAGLRIVAIIETQRHDDHRSGAAALATSTGAAVYRSAASASAAPFSPLHDRSVVAVGTVRLSCIATPGHTEDSLCLSLQGHDKVLTGDTLLVGSVGTAGAFPKAADLLLTSVRQRLLTLDEHVEVYPGHFGPHRGLPAQRVTTVGEQRRTNVVMECTDGQTLARLLGPHWHRLPAADPAVVAANLGTAP